MGKGKVYLIGAGPGDPGLITVKGLDCIREADVIVYDYLANARFVEDIKKSAELIYVGKMGGAHTLSQDEINRLIIKKAKGGKVVARLKGGDPFIFGRGGEEAEELAEAGIPFEIVPGVTSAVSAPAYAGIPLTHRDFTSTVAFITGHEDPTKGESGIAWEKISTGVGTLVFLMGMKNIAYNVSKLLENGRAPETPVALVRWGTKVEQETLVGRLDNIVDLVEEKRLRPPVVMVVGGVVNLRSKLNWFETRPLFGRRIIVTRSRAQASDFSSLLERCGADAIEFPTIKTAPPTSWHEADRSLQRLSRYDWIIFTSVNGVGCFIERLKKSGKDIRELKGIKVCAIGPSTARAMESLGVRVDLTPKEYRAESIIDGLGKRRIKGKRFLLPRAMEAREILPEEIKRLGGNVDVVPVYKTVKPREKTDYVRQLLEDGLIDAVTFTSSSTVKNFIGMFRKGEGVALLKNTNVACIGPITGETARGYGLDVALMPKKFTIPALTEEMARYFSRKQRRKAL